MLVVPVVIVVALPLLLIVATAVLLEFHVATSVIMNGPLHVFAVAVNCSGLP